MALEPSGACLKVSLCSAVLQILLIRLSARKSRRTKSNEWCLAIKNKNKVNNSSSPLNRQSIEFRHSSIKWGEKGTKTANYCNLMYIRMTCPSQSLV